MPLESKLVKAPASPARVAANRANAQKSTGPRTEEGKARSRANAVKHGLTGAGIALPTEAKGEVEGLFDDFQAQYAPQDPTTLGLVFLAALSLTRIKRGAKQEAAALAYAIRHAVDDDVEQRLTEADENIKWLNNETPTRYRRLLATPEGIERLIDRLQTIRNDIGNPKIRFNYIHAQCLDPCFGREDKYQSRTRTQVLAKAVDHDDEWLTDEERAEIAEQYPHDVCGTSKWAMPKLRALIDEEVARLEAVRVTLDPATLRQDRIEANVRATFGASREAALARRYEAHSVRTYFRVVRDLKAIQREEITADDPIVQQTLAPPSPTAAQVLDEADAVEIRDPADDPAVGKPQRDPNFRIPLASSGITVQQASAELSYPHYDRPPTPHDMPLPPLTMGKLVIR